MTILSLIQCQNLPKIVLHDHLDGGLRPGTVQELLQEQSIDLPWKQGGASAWFKEKADAKSLPQYLEVFSTTLACMQTLEGLHRVAREAAQDLQSDNVRYAELRFAPLLCTQRGLSPHAVVEAVLDGLKGHPIKLILCAIRNKDTKDAMRTVELAREFRDKGVVGVDLAGPEEGFPPRLHTTAFKKAHDAGLGITIHAGEVCGLESISSAIEHGFAQRIGHGIQIINSLKANGQLCDLAWDILERNIILEVCPSSNVQTAAVPSLKEHPWKTLDHLGFPITLNTDNRLLGGVTTSQEWYNSAQTFGITQESAYRYLDNAIGGLFVTSEVKNELRKELKQHKNSHLQYKDVQLMRDI